MTQAIRKFRPEDPVADISTEISASGVAIIENLFPAHAIDSLTTNLAADLEAQEPGGGQLFGNRKRSVGGLLGRGPEFSEHLLGNERVLELADAILLPECPVAANSTAPKPPGFFDVPDPAIGPNCHHYRINATVAMQVCRGGHNQELHRDEWRYLPYMRPDPDGPEVTLAVMVALTDFTAGNGATRYVPGSHRWPRNQRPNETEVVQAIMPSGSAAFWLGTVFHGLGASVVDEPRTGIIYSFVVDRFTQEENQFTAVPPIMAATLPKRAQQLIGYRSSHALNFIKDLDDNHVLSH